MAGFFRNMALAVASALMMVACQEGAEAGDLLGQWRMQGSTAMYVKFSGHLACFSKLDSGNVWGHFQTCGDSIFIQCYSIDALPEDTLLVEETFGMEPFEDIRLRIDNLDDDCLAVSRNGRRWVFEKY